MTLLIADYFRGSLDRETEIKVEQWIAESEQNYEFAKECLLLEQMGSDIKMSEQLDVAGPFAKTQAKIRRRACKKHMSIVRNVAAFSLIPALAVIAALAWWIFKPSEVAMLEVTTATGVTTSVTLPDGSQVWLNSKSKLCYPAEFRHGKREVTLDGEAYFKVSADKKHQFVVNVGDVRIGVYGTEFNVEAYSKSSNTITTSLYTGSISMSFPDASKNRKEIAMEPGQKCIYDVNSCKVTRQQANPTVDTSWKSGRIVLNSTTFAEALRLIGNMYDVEFIVKNKVLLDKKYTGTFTNQRLEVIFDHFTKSAGVHFDIDYAGLASDVNGGVSGRQVIVVH